MNPLPHHPLSAKTSSNGSWPPAPSGHAWLNPNDTVTREDIDVRDGYVAPVEARDLGCRAGSPIVFAEGGGFIAGTQLQRRFREHKTFILKGRS